MNRKVAYRWLGLVILVVASLLLPSAAWADSPLGGVEGATDPGPGPLTRKEQASLDAKHDLVKALLAEDGEGLVMPEAVCKTGQPPPCIWPRPDDLTLNTMARHQHRWFYCGPAVVQVASNLSWGFYSTSECGAHCPAGTNKYGQHTISDNWTDTDLHGETYVADLKRGMNQATQRPEGFAYAYEGGMTWADFHAGVEIDTWWYHLPVAARVDPRESGSAYFLCSWRNMPGGDYGHWILLRGYAGHDQPTADIYYNDSSGGVDEHNGTVLLGDTGSFPDRSYTVWRTMKNNQAGSTWYLIW